MAESSNDGDAPVETNQHDMNHRYRDADDEIDYSTTRRWRERCRIWRLYSQEIDDWVNNNNVNIAIPQLQPSELFFQSDEHPSFKKIAELGVLLTDYKALHGDLSTLENDIQALQAEIQTLQAEVRTLQGELQGLQEELELRTSSEEESNRLGQLIETQIEDKRGWIEDKRKLMEVKRRSIEHIEASIEYKRGTIESNRGWIVARRVNIEKHLEEVATRHAALCRDLDILKERGNYQNSATSSTVKPTLSIDSKRIDLGRVASGPSELQALVHPIKDPALEKTLAERVVDDNVRKNLSKFQKFVADLVETSPAYDKRKSQNAARLDETVKTIMDWDPENPPNEEDIESCNLVRPSFTSNDENNVDQPILRAILLRIIKMIGLSHSLTSEHSVPSVETEAGASGGGIIDLVSHNPTRESFSSLLAAMLGQAIELKAVSNKKKEMKKRLKKEENRVLRHLVKQAWFSCDVGGVGENCEVYGITLTLWSVSVEKLALRDVGTVNAKVVTKKTPRLCLLGTDYTLPPKVESLVLDGNYNAFTVLAGALLAVCTPPGQAELERGDSQLLEENNGEEKQLETERLLGSGAFSNIVKLKAKGQFLKIPKAAVMLGLLEHEANVLSQLNGRGEDIPQLVNEKDPKPSRLKFIHKGDVGGFTGLKLKGIVGVTLALCREYDHVDLANIIHKVFKALEYAHQQGYCHLDVRPENVIVDPITKKVMLSDWGVASERNVHIAFRGCLPYAHDGWFANNNHEAIPNEAYDFASLLYTWMHVTGDTPMLPWNDDFQRISRVNKLRLKKRRKHCKEAFLGEKQDCYYFRDNDNGPLVPEPAFSVLLDGAHLRNRVSPRRSAARAQQDQSDNKRSQPSSASLVGNAKGGKRRKGGRKG